MSLWNEMNPWYKDDVLPQSEQRAFAYLILAALAGLVASSCAAIFFIIVLIMGAT